MWWYVSSPANLIIHCPWDLMLALASSGSIHAGKVHSSAGITSNRASPLTAADMTVMNSSVQGSLLRKTIG